MSTDDSGARRAATPRRTSTRQGRRRPTGDDAPARRALRRVLISLGVLGLVLALARRRRAVVPHRALRRQHRPGRRRLRRPRRGAPGPRPPTPAESAPRGAGHLPAGRLRHPGETLEGEDPDGRSDAIMIARFSADRQHAQLISIPRDSWVDIPGHGMNKINASYAFGGPTLLIQTVEQLTQVRIDHYVAIDFDGLIQVTDDLGGVDVVVAETTQQRPVHLPGRRQPPRRRPGPLVPRPALRPAGRRLRPGEAAAAVPAVDVRQAVQLRHLHRPRPARLGAARGDQRGEHRRHPGQRRPAGAGLLAARRHARTASSSSPRRCWAPAWRARPASSTSTRSPASGCGPTCAATRWRRTPTSSATQALPDVPR